MSTSIDQTIRVLFGSSSPVDEARQGEWNSFAGQMWSLVCQTLGESPAGVPDLRIVRGRVGRPQVLSSDGLDYLIYDESLDPWLARLSEIAANRVPLAAVESSLLHLVSLRQLSNGHLDEAVRDALAMPTVVLANYLDSARRRYLGTDDPVETAPNVGSKEAFRFDINQFVRLQREFIVTHELVHIFFQRFPDRLSDVMEDFRTMVIAPERRRPMKTTCA